MPEPNAVHAHNLFAQAAAEWGGVGLLLMLALTGLIGWVLWRRWRDADTAPEELLAATWVVCLLAHSMAEHPLWFMNWLLPLGLMVGLLKQPLCMLRPAGAAPRPAARALLLVGVVSLNALAAWDYQRMQFLVLRIVGDNQQPPGTPPRVSVAEVARVESLTLFPRFAQILLSMKLPIDDQAVQAKAGIAREAMDAVPAGETVARYATFAVMAGQGDEARRLLLDFGPRNPPHYESAYTLLKQWSGADPRLASFVAGLPVPVPVPVPTQAIQR